MQFWHTTGGGIRLVGTEHTHDWVVTFPKYTVVFAVVVLLQPHWLALKLKTVMLLIGPGL